MTYPGVSFPTSLDTLNQVGPEGGSVQAQNSQGETHAGIHAQLAAVLSSVETVIGVTGSADTNSIMYRLGQLGGTAGLGQGVRNTTGGTAVTSADRGFLVANTGGGTVTLPTTAAVGNGFIFTIWNSSLVTSLTLSTTGGNGIYFPSGLPSGGSSSITLLPAESLTLFADSGAWVIAGGAGQRIKPQVILAVITALTDAATITTDASLGNKFSVTVAASRTLAAPTNPSDGQQIEYIITQGGAGSNIITWNAIFNVGATVSFPTLSTVVGKRDRITFEYSSAAAKWDLLAYALGF